MRVDEFDFDLPETLIARFPPEERDASRLMVLDRKRKSRDDRRFAELPALLQPNDILVLNDTKVLAARLRARKATTEGRVEILLVEPRANGFLAMVNASKPVRAGTRLRLDRDERIAIDVAAVEGEGFVILALGAAEAIDLAHRFGEIPLPPYLGRSAVESDAVRYQTVFAKDDAEGSVAAPTAGLHFTPRVFDALRARGIAWTHLTLHVGPGTFLPVRTDDVESHRMLPERYALSEAAAEAISNARQKGGRVIAVGTTVTRVLESIGWPIRCFAGATDLFIKPGHAFSVVDALVTNFHLPRSTLIMLVSAFAGRDTILDAYRAAVASCYRFFSYGDAMLIL
jgi:S-adenosylmethionine:tRNA ribosyltransferase-isomerase